MADHPVYPSQLDPKAWEKNKGLLAKAAVKADVKGALDKAGKIYWEGVPWDTFREWESARQEEIAAAAAKAKSLCDALAVVHANANAGLQSVDKIPGSKLTMKSSRAYLEAMAKSAADCSAAVDHYAKSIVAAHAARHAAEARAQASFDGWLSLHAQKTTEIVNDCLARLKATKGSLAGTRDPERSALKQRELKNAADYVQSLDAIYVEGDRLFKSEQKTTQLMYLKKYNAFKAAQPAQLKTMHDAIAEIQAK